MRLLKAGSRSIGSWQIEAARSARKIRYMDPGIPLTHQWELVLKCVVSAPAPMAVLVTTGKGTVRVRDQGRRGFHHNPTSRPWSRFCSGLKGSVLSTPHAFPMPWFPSRFPSALLPSSRGMALGVCANSGYPICGRGRLIIATIATIAGGRRVEIQAALSNLRKRVGAPSVAAARASCVRPLRGNPELPQHSARRPRRLRGAARLLPVE